MLKWMASLGLGAATFLATHIIIVVKWGLWFQGVNTTTPWFLNDGSRAVGLTAGALCLAAGVAAALQARTQYESVMHGACVAVGATIAATAVAFSIGPGTIFPIVIAFCAAVAFVSTIVGASVVAAFQKR